MRRQFYRLYILIIASCALIVWSFNLLYMALEDDAYAYTIEIKSLFDLSRNTRLFNELTPDSIAFSDELQHQLNQNDIVALQRGDQTLYYYRLNHDHSRLQQLGPFPNPQKPPASLATLVPLLYGALAVAIMMLIGPVFRDLAKLQQDAIQFGKHPKRLHSNIPKRSAIYPLARGFENMTRQILDFIKMHKDLSRTISHEIRTPLSRMRFVLELVKKELPSDYAKRFSADIDEIEQLTQNYLSFARLEHQQLSPKFEWLNAQQFLSELEQKFSIYREHIEMEFVIDCSASLGKVRLEPLSMTLACQNLIANSMRYAKSKLRISLIATQRHWQITVEDDGPGVGNQGQLLRKAFVRGAQQNSSGFGLGLYIVRKIAIWHHGSLKVSPSIDLGGAAMGVKWRRYDAEMDDKP